MAEQSSKAEEIWDRHAERAVRRPTHDATSQLQMALARLWIRDVEKAMEAEHIPVDYQYRIIHRLVYGCLPTEREEWEREVEYAERLAEVMTRPLVVTVDAETLKTLGLPSMAADDA